MAFNLIMFPKGSTEHLFIKAINTFLFLPYILYFVKGGIKFENISEDCAQPISRCRMLVSYTVYNFFFVLYFGRNISRLVLE